MTKPTLEYIQGLRQELRSVYSRRDSLFGEYERLYRLQFDVEAPIGKRAYRLPTAHSLVNDAINQVVANPPKILVPRRSETQKAQEQAEKLTDFLNCLWAWLSQRSGGSILRKGLWYNYVRGVFAYKVLYDPDAWGKSPKEPTEPPDIDALNSTGQEFYNYVQALTEYQKHKTRYEEDLDRYEARKDSNFPILIQARDPKWVYPEPVECPTYVIEVYPRRVSEVKRRWPKLQLNKRKDTDIVEWVEYWDDTYKAYYCYDARYGNNGWEEVFPITEHEYGFMPYVISGSYSTPSQKPEELYESLFYGVKDLISYESTLFTQMAHILKAYAWPITKVFTSNPKGKRIDMEPGAVNYFDKSQGEDAAYLEWQSTEPGINTQIRQVRDYIEWDTVSNVLKGMGPTGRSGYQQSLVATLARLKILPVEQDQQAAIQRVNEMVLNLIDNVIGERVRLWALGAGEVINAEASPKLIRGYYRNVAKVQAVLPVDEANKARMGIELKRERIISRLTAARDYANIDDPEEEQVRIMVEDILESAPMKAARSIEAAKEWGIDLDQAQAMSGQMNNEESMPPPPAPAPGPGQGEPEGMQAMSPKEADLAFRRAKAGGLPPRRRLPPPSTPGV